MKIGDFPIVEALVAHRNHLIGLRDEGKVHVQINGRVMPDDFGDKLLPAVKQQLTDQIKDIDGQLVQLGVSIN